MVNHLGLNFKQLKVVCLKDDYVITKETGSDAYLREVYI